MKILHVTPSITPHGGGVATAVAGITTTLAQKDVECTVFSTVGTRVGDDPYKLDGVESHVFHTSKLARFWYGHSLKLRSSLQKVIPSYDLIHIHDLWNYPGFAAYQVAKSTNKPYVMSIHAALDPDRLSFKAYKKRPYLKFIQRKILNQASTLFALTITEKEHIENLGISSPISVIPNGIFPEIFNTPNFQAGVLKQLSQVKDKYIILYLGRIHPLKGIDLLVEAFGDIAKIREDVCLVIAGDDEVGYRSQLELQLSNLGILDKTIFTGLLNETDKVAMLGIADIFVLPSYSEGFSMSILEAMASSLPVIITDKCYFSEVGTSGAGIIVETESDQLRDALMSYFENPEKIKQMGGKGRQLVLQKYTWDKVVDQIKLIYQNLI